MRPLDGLMYAFFSSRNVAFARLLAQIIRLRTQFPDHPIKTIHLDNVGEFSSQAFLDYYISIGTDVQHHVAHVHFQNGLAEFFIKCLQLIARPLLLKTKLLLSAWGHAIIHAAHLIRLCPTANHNLSHYSLLKVITSIFCICEFLVLLFMFQLPLHIDLLYWLLVFILAFNLHLL